MARPREFDTDQALDAAIETFWTHGYEGTSVNDLLESMGLQKGSLYKAFGDKRSLYLTALRRYIDRVRRGVAREVEGIDSPRGKIVAWIALTRHFGEDRQGTLRKGCMAVNTLIEKGPHDPEVQALVEEYFRGVERFMAGVIAEGQRRGEFRSDLPSEQLARYLIEYVSGVLTVSRGSLSFINSEDHAELALRALLP
jgi:TetR/AcrR family transcriptional repressor of nem operon